VGKYIVKLGEHYLEWSTISDAPTTFGMTLGEFQEYYQDEYGNEGMYGLPRRMERVAEQGHSCLLPYTLDELLERNRAGSNETELTKEEIVQAFCIQKVNDE